MSMGDKRPDRGAAAARVDIAHAPVSDASARAAFIADATTVMGIPEAELTPKVHDTILALMRETDELRQEVDTLRRRLQEAESEADLDPLVPTLNRRAFVRELSRVISFSERYNIRASLVYFDLNNFKKINDVYGHTCGDVALLHVARLITDNVRESDIVGRLGGDEFAVILAHTDEDVAHIKAEQLRAAVAANPFQFEDKELALSVTPGVSTFRAGDDAATALDRADQAMYETRRKNTAQD